MLLKARDEVIHNSHNYEVCIELHIENGEYSELIEKEDNNEEKLLYREQGRNAYVDRNISF